LLLYLHIPFCDSKCFYCSFNSYTNKFDFRENYIQAVIKQLDYEVQRYGLKGKTLQSLFIGGGTPSTIKPKLYEPFFKKISPYMDENTEITTEANPNSATKEWIKGLKSLGVNRISFGVQSFDDEKLKYLGRNHTSKSAVQAVENAHKVGFENISIDLIHDCPIDSKKGLQKDINIAKNLPINHISSYSLSIEKGTKFYEIKEKSKENIKEQILFYEQIEQAGFPRYEVSNFGTYICKHNVGYWKHKDYIGIGAGAVGFQKDKRFYPHKNIESYISNPIFFDEENLSKYELKEEKIFLGLRSIVGFDMEILNEKERLNAEILIKEKKIIQKDGKIYNLDYLLSDEIALFILG